jgi:drug/metabolite transporter (DMT)-like permease
MAPSLAELGQAPGRVWLSVMGLGVFASGLAFLVFYRLVSEIGAFMASLSTYIMPLFGLFWGMLLLDERATPGMLLGGVLVLASAGLFVTKPKKSAK